MSDLKTNDWLNKLTDIASKLEGQAHLHEPLFEGNEWEYVKGCLDSGWVSSVGQYVDQFENDLSEYTGSKFVIATSNGTSALHLSCVALGIGPGDEVLVPSISFVATANAVSYTGAGLHFVDCEERTLAVCPDKLKSYLDSIGSLNNGVFVNKNTKRPIKALVVAHVLGNSAQIQSLKSVCQDYRLLLIEDAAEALGTTSQGTHVGLFGDIGALSFNGNKIITTGGGGAILTNNEELARKCRHLGTTAKLSHKWDFVHDEVGYNYRMPNINAALGCAQLKKLESFINTKAELFSAYQSLLSDSVEFIEPLRGTKSNFWLTGIRLREVNSNSERDQYLSLLHDAGILARPIWKPLHLLPMYNECQRSDMSVAEKLESQLICLPSGVQFGRNVLSLI